MASLRIHSLPIQPSIGASRRRATSQVVEVRTEFGPPGSRWADFRPVCSLDDGKAGKENGFTRVRKFVARSVNAVGELRKASLPSVTYAVQKYVKKSASAVEELQGVVSSLPPVTFVMSQYNGKNFAIGLGFAITMLFISVRVYFSRKSRNARPGSVADLVRRGQLRSDRRGISKPLQYDDPFDNPYVKVGKQKSTVEMCGKVYRLAPVSLTDEQRAVHQKRRSRAYQWKRPTIFLKEGDQIPPDVDPDTVRWIPANHPFATTTTDIDEDLAQNNVYQKHGVPFRIQAEHEALQKKLEALQNEQKLDKLVIDASAAKDFERPFKSRVHEPEDQSTSATQHGNSRSHFDQSSNPTAGNYNSEETQQQ
uniref:Protein MULTIPLE CHLOROPLAST DIVISION SITE 1 n=1 Tax=Kalanchoe fedtschenkoi TaxID=63787 RepID=A0A7N0SZV0_KALFE